MINLEKKQFYKKLLQLSLPMMLHQLLLNSVSFIDTLMIGQLGAKSVAAVGLANQMFFLINLIYFGLGSGTGVLLSQFWGARKIKDFKKTFIIALFFSSLFSLFFCLASFFFPEYIMGFFTTDKEVISLGVSYLKVVSISYIFSAIGYIYATAFRAAHNTKLPLFIATIALTINTIGNYLLIFGIGPFPQLGVRGAAIATTFCRFLEVFLLILLSYNKKNIVIGIRNIKAYKYSKDFIKKYIKGSSPVVLNELTWALGMVAYKYAFSKMGTNVLAAVQVTESITGLFFVVAMGFSMSASIMVGNKVGEKNYDLAQSYAIRFNYISILSGILMGLILYLSAPFLTHFFALEDIISNLIINTLSIFALLLPIKFLTTAIIVGSIRGGGSTTFAFILEAFCVWLIGVPSVFISIFIFNLPLPMVYLAMGLEEVGKSLIGLRKIKSKTWIKDLT
ncbi:MAG: MATE family efflux transporter [Pleomorphochaeta sp.]